MSVINFSYSLKKDLENYKNSWFDFKYPQYGRNKEQLVVNKFLFPTFIQKIESVNSVEDKSKFAQLFLDKYYAKYGNHIEKMTTNLGESWRIIEPIFIARLENYFGVETGFESANCYLTTLTIAPFNASNKNFMVSLYAGLPTQLNTIMHEFMHLYFLNNFSEMLKGKGLDRQSILEINESLIVLLNYEFGDILLTPAYNNKPSTMDLQKVVLSGWRSKKNFNVILEELVSLRSV